MNHSLLFREPRGFPIKSRVAPGCSVSEEANLHVAEPQLRPLDPQPYPLGIPEANRPAAQAVEETTGVMFQTKARRLREPRFCHGGDNSVNLFLRVAAKCLLRSRRLVQQIAYFLYGLKVGIDGHFSSRPSGIVPPSPDGVR